MICRKITFKFERFHATLFFCAHHNAIAVAIAEFEEQKVGLVIKRLLTPGSISEYAMGRPVLGSWERHFTLISKGPSSLPNAVYQSDKRLANRTQKKSS